MEQKKDNIHSQEVPEQRCVRRKAPDEEDLEKLLKRLKENRPKVSLTPAEIEEDLKFFSQIMKGTDSSSDTPQEKVGINRFRSSS